MSDSKIIIHFERFSLPLKIYIFLLFWFGGYGKYKLQEQKFRLIITSNLEGNEKLNFIRRLFIVMNLLEVSRVKTIY